MSVAWGAAFISPAGATSDRPHIFAYAAARTTAGHKLLSVRNGPTSGDEVFAVDKDGNTDAAGTLAVGGAATLSSTLAVTGAVALSSTLAVTGNLTAAGVLLMGAAAAGGASAGDIVLPSEAALWLDSGAGADIPLVASTSGDDLVLGDSSTIVFIGAADQTSGSNAGDVVLANTKSIRSENAAGSATLALIGLDSANRLILGNTTSTTYVGSSAGTTLTATTITTPTSSTVTIGNNSSLILGGNTPLRMTGSGGVQTVLSILGGGDTLVISGLLGTVRYGPVCHTGGSGGAAQNPTVHVMTGPGPQDTQSIGWLPIEVSGPLDGGNYSTAWIPVWR